MITFGGIDFEVVVGEHIDCISCEELENKMGEKMYMAFHKFMQHQTCTEDGAFVCDVENFFRRPENRFFD